MRRQLEEFEERMADRLLLRSCRSEEALAAAAGEEPSVMAAAMLDGSSPPPIAREAGPRLECHVASLSTQCQHLAEELSMQARRLDESDARLKDWRRQLESGLAERLRDLDAQQQQVGAALRLAGAASDDLFEKLDRRVERLEEGLVASGAAARQGEWQEQQRRQQSQQQNQLLSRHLRAVDARLRELEAITHHASAAPGVGGGMGSSCSGGGDLAARPSANAGLPPPLPPVTTQPSEEEAAAAAVAPAAAAAEAAASAAEAAAEAAATAAGEAAEAAEAAAAERGAAEAKLEETRAQVEQIVLQRNELQVQVEAHEERMRSLRTIVETSEAHARGSRYQLLEWENRAKELKALSSEWSRGSRDHTERVNLLNNRLDAQAQALEDLREELDRHREQRSALLNASASASAAGAGAGAFGEGASALSMVLPPSRPLTPSAAGGGAIAALAQEEMRCLEARLGAVEGAVEGLADELDRRLAMAARQAEAASEAGPCLASVAESLRTLLPRVNEQDRSLREMSERVRQLGVRVNMAANVAKAFAVEPPSAASAARLKWLEAEVEQLKELVGKPSEWDTTSRPEDWEPVAGFCPGTEAPGAGHLGFGAGAGFGYDAGGGRGGG